jgi:hypothetical protein
MPGHNTEQIGFFVFGEVVSFCVFFFFLSPTRTPTLIASASATSHEKRMLGFVPGLHEPMLDIASTGYYEQHIDHADVYGGHTKSSTIVKLNQDRFVLVDDEVRLARRQRTARLVHCRRRLSSRRSRPDLWRHSHRHRHAKVLRRRRRRQAQEGGRCRSH